MKFKIGDKVKCINPSSRLIQGRNYTIKDISEGFYTYDVVDDFGHEVFLCYEFRFEDIKKIRKEKLEKLKNEA
jgi:hypothetical protein